MSDQTRITYYGLYKEANRLLDKSKISLGEYERMIEPLNDEVRKVGKWIAVDSDDMNYDHYKCSNCWCEISVDCKRICDIGFTIEDFDYCLQCGAKMERSE